MQLHQADGSTKLASSKLGPAELTSLDAYKHRRVKQISTAKYKKLLRDGINHSCEQKAFATIATIAGTTSLSSLPESSNLLNLSDVSLHSQAISVLSHGYNVCRATGGCEEFTLLKDVDNFARNIRLQEFIHGCPISDDEPKALPSQHDKCIYMYVKAVQREVLELYKNQIPFRKRLSAKETKAIKTLATHPEVIIKPADKGGAVVVMNRSDYLNEVYRQLTDEAFYKRLHCGLTAEFKAIVKKALEILLPTKLGLT